jgi:hypothetical protein
MFFIQIYIYVDVDTTHKGHFLGVFCKFLSMFYFYDKTVLNMKMIKRFNGFFSLNGNRCEGVVKCCEKGQPKWKSRK